MFHNQRMPHSFSHHLLNKSDSSSSISITILEEKNKPIPKSKNLDNSSAEFFQDWDVFSIMLSFLEGLDKEKLRRVSKSLSFIEIPPQYSMVNRFLSNLEAEIKDKSFFADKNYVEIRDPRVFSCPFIMIVMIISSVALFLMVDELKKWLDCLPCDRDSGRDCVGLNQAIEIDTGVIIGLSIVDLTAAVFMLYRLRHFWLSNRENLHANINIFFQGKDRYAQLPLTVFSPHLQAEAKQLFMKLKMNHPNLLVNAKTEIIVDDLKSEMKKLDEKLEKRSNSLTHSHSSMFSRGAKRSENMTECARTKIACTEAVPSRRNS